MEEMIKEKPPPSMKKNPHNKPDGIKLESAIKSEKLNANAVIAAQRTAIERINTAALN